MTDPSGDPVFQLNTVLWMLQPLPNRVGALQPVLYNAGYRVRALGKSLPPRRRSSAFWPRSSI
jgi:hypothetical protein